MVNQPDDPSPSCPECGEPIGSTATYCMHCGADLTQEQKAADTDNDEAWEVSGDQVESQDDSVGWEFPGEEEESSGSGSGDDSLIDSGDVADAVASAGGSGASGGGSTASSGTATGDGQLLDPDGMIDNTLTIIVGIIGGVVVGFIGFMVMLFATESAWALPMGMLAWLIATAVLVRQRTVQGAVSKTAYAIAVVLLTIPLVMLSPVVEAQSITERLTGAGIILIAVAVPAVVAAGIGRFAEHFVPDEGGEV